MLKNQLLLILFVVHLVFKSSYFNSEEQVHALEKIEEHFAERCDT